MAMIQQTRTMSLVEFMRRYAEAPFELIDGEIIPVTPTTSQHVIIAKRLFMALLKYEKQGLGEVFNEATFILTDDPEWVRGSRVPDVMFVLKETLEAYYKSIPEAEEKPFIFVPEIVAEVISPNDKYSEVTHKVSRYLADGVRLIWIIDPQRKVITVKGEHDVELGENDILTGGTVLPDFELSLIALFAESSI
jgi:Uma2 family endonuclease